MDSGGGDKTTAAVILMRELVKRGHRCMYLSSDQIKNFSFDLSKVEHSVIVIDEFNEFPMERIFQLKIIQFILAAYDKPSIRIVITSSNGLDEFKEYITHWVYFPYERLSNADQFESCFDTLMKRSGASGGLDFSSLPMRRK